MCIGVLNFCGILRFFARWFRVGENWQSENAERKLKTHPEGGGGLDTPTILRMVANGLLEE